MRWLDTIEYNMKTVWGEDMENRDEFRTKVNKGYQLIRIKTKKNKNSII